MLQALVNSEQPLTVAELIEQTGITESGVRYVLRPENPLRKARLIIRNGRQYTAHHDTIEDAHLNNALMVAHVKKESTTKRRAVFGRRAINNKRVNRDIALQIGYQIWHALAPKSSAFSPQSSRSVQGDNTPALDGKSPENGVQGEITAKGATDGDE